MPTHAKPVVGTLAALLLAALAMTFLVMGAGSAAAGERARVERAVEKKVERVFKRWGPEARVLSCRSRSGGRFKCHWFAENPGLWWGEGNAKVKPRNRGYKVKLRRVIKECVGEGHECAEA